LFDHRGYNRPVLPAGALAEVVGAVEGEALYSDPDNRPRLNNPHNDPWPDPIYNGPLIRFDSPVEAEFYARAYLVPLEPTGGKTIGRCDAMCLGVHNAFGKGGAYYFGTHVGLALAMADAGAMELIKSIVALHCQPKVRGSALRPRLIEGDGEALLAVFNNSRTQRLADRIELPREYRQVQDIQAGERISPARGAIQLEVDPEDVRVLHLTK